MKKLLYFTLFLAGCAPLAAELAYNEGNRGKNPVGYDDEQPCCSCLAWLCGSSKTPVATIKDNSPTCHAVVAGLSPCSNRGFSGASVQRDSTMSISFSCKVFPSFNNDGAEQNDLLKVLALKGCVCALDISSCKNISPELLARLGELHNLRSLNLAFSNVAVATVMRLLKECRLLEEINLVACGLSLIELKELHRLFPRVELRTEKEVSEQVMPFFVPMEME